MSSNALPYFLYSLGIILREGAEAMLVVVALAAGTHETSKLGRTRDVYLGAALAVIASIALAWAVNHLISDDASDTLEGVFQLLAAATLFLVSSWLTAKGQAGNWNKFLDRQVDRASRATIPGLTLGLTSFLAVMREGAETIVFFQALTNGASAGAERHAIAAGLVVGGVALALAFVFVERAAIRIPIGAFFTWTSILLYALAVVFVGQGVASLQEADRIGATFIPYAPTIGALGIYPTIQTLGAQLILLAIAGARMIFPRRHGFVRSIKDEAIQAVSQNR